MVGPGDHREVVEPAAVTAEETEVKEKTEVSSEAIDNQAVKEVNDVTGESSRERKDAVEPVKEMPMSVKAPADSAKDTAELVKAQWNPPQKILTSGRHPATLRDYSPRVFRRLLMQWDHRVHTKKREWLMGTDETREFSWYI